MSFTIGYTAMTRPSDLLAAAVAVALCSSAVLVGVTPVGATSADAPTEAPPLASDLRGDPIAQVADDEDGDGIPDDEDPFPLDPDNGLSTNPPVTLDFETDANDPLDPSVGFTGLMTNGSDYRALYDPANVTVANGTLTVETVQPTDPFGPTNDGENAFQFGTTTPSDRPFVVHATIPSGFDGEIPAPFRNYGIFVGDGTQSNYTKLVVGAREEDDAVGEIELVVEENDSVQNLTNTPESSVIGGTVDLYLTVDPTTDPTPNDGSDDVAATYEYAVDGGERTQVGDGAVPIPAAWFADANRTAAVGVINTANGTSGTYAASYDLVEVETLEPTPDAPPALPGFESAPTDPDGDGVYEDVNGNGELSLADVTALFANAESPEVTENAAAYDFNDNGEFTLADVTVLFEAASPPAA